MEVSLVSLEAATAKSRTFVAVVTLDSVLLLLLADCHSCVTQMNVLLWYNVTISESDVEAS